MHKTGWNACDPVPSFDSSPVASQVSRRGYQAVDMTQKFLNCGGRGTGELERNQICTTTQKCTTTCAYSYNNGKYRFCEIVFERKILETQIKRKF